MKVRNFLFLISFFFLIASCGMDSGSSSSSSEGSSSSDDEKNIANAVEKSKNALQDLLSDGKEDGKSVEVINWRELKELLPNKLGGMKLDDTEGQTTGMMGFKFSKTEGKYRGDDGRMNVNIIDLGGIQLLVTQFAAWSELDIDSDTSDGYQKTTDYKGYKAFEEYNEKNNSGSFAVLVEDRFAVTIDGRGIEMDDLKDAIDDVGIKKLARMAK